MVKGVGFKRTAAIFGIINAVFWTLLSLACIALLSFISGVLGEFLNEFGDMLIDVGVAADIQGALDMLLYIFIGLGAVSIVNFILSIMFCSGRKKQTVIGIIIILINAAFLSTLAYATHLMTGVDLGEFGGIASSAMGFLIALLSVNAIIILFTFIYLIRNAGNNAIAE